MATARRQSPSLAEFLLREENHGGSIAQDSQVAMPVAGVAGLARRIAAPWPSAGGRLSSSPTETRVGGEVAWPGGLALPRHRCQTSPEMQEDAQTPSPGPAPFSPQDAASNPNVPEMRVLRHVFLLLRAFSLSRCLDQPTAVHRIWTFSTRSRTAWREARQGSADAGRGQSAEASAAGRRGALLPPLLRAHDFKKRERDYFPHQRVGKEQERCCDSFL